MMPVARVLSIVLFSIAACAQEPADLSGFLSNLRQALSRSDTAALSRMLAAGAELRVGTNVMATGPEAVAQEFAAGRIWSEQSPPLLKTVSLRMVANDIALVDATETRIGALILRETTPVLLVLHRNGAEWQIASIRFSAGLLCATPRLP
jgi:type IV secretory pathway protease TraF